MRVRIWKKGGVWHWRVRKPGFYGDLTITGGQPTWKLALAAALTAMGREAA